jgi:hypothetical protein
MPLYPLGISRSRDVAGLPQQAPAAAAMRWCVAGELACALIDAPHRPIPPMLHATALAAIHRRVCVLPVRYGAALRDEGEIHALLVERRRELLDRLRRLQGTCEMGLRIVPPGRPKTPLPAAAEQASALAYLDRRRMLYRQADDEAERGRSIAEHVAERLGGHFRQWRRLPSSPTQPIRLAFLVEQDRVGAFRTRAEEIRKAHGEHRCAILGPWPPYSFAEGAAERGHADVGGAQGIEPVQGPQEQQPHFALLQRGGDPPGNE